MDKVICCDCGKECVSDGFGAGYGTDKKGNHFCYDCCGEHDKRDLENMQIGDSICLYLTENKTEAKSTYYFVTNWPGTLKIPIYYVKEGQHNMAGVRHDVWFSFHGNNFHGTQYGNFSQLCHVKCVK